MARKKTTKRRRRVGGMKLGSGMGLTLLAAAGGFLLSDTLNNELDKILSKPKKGETTPRTYNKALVYAPEMGLGGLLLMSKGGKMKTAKQVLGGALLGAGLKLALKDLGVLKGYQNVPVVGRRRMAGYQSTPVIAGTPGQLQGVTPSQLNGFRVNGYEPQGSGVMAGVTNGMMEPNANGSGRNGVSFGG
jgi:hypothetical protein